MSDPVTDAYKQGIDRTLVRENLRRTPEERIRNLMQLQKFAEELKRAGRAQWRNAGATSAPSRVSRGTS